MIYLAPLQGMTDRIYRNLFSVYFKGVDYAVAPFIPSVKKMKSENKLLRDLDPGANTGLFTIPQIMSSCPEDFVQLANRLYEMGHHTVNWNLGCPFPMVVKKGRGSGMLCYPDRIASFLDKAAPALKPSLSIKLRIGMKDPDEALRLIPVFNRFALEELIIHPRTGAQMYQGDVDLDIFGQCLGLSKHRIVYNGDIDSFEKYEMLSNRFESVDRWMIGRGLLGNPFLAEKIKFNTEKPYDERIKIMRAFHDRLFDEYSNSLSGPAHITNKMKEVWTYMGSFFEGREKIIKSIRKARHREHYADIVHKAFDALMG